MRTWKKKTAGKQRAAMKKRKESVWRYDLKTEERSGVRLRGETRGEDNTSEERHTERRREREREREKAYERTRRPGLLVQCRRHCHGNEWRESADEEEGIRKEGRDHFFTPRGDGGGML